MCVIHIRNAVRSKLTPKCYKYLCKVSKNVSRAVRVLWYEVLLRFIYIYFYLSVSLPEFSSDVPHFDPWMGPKKCPSNNYF